MKITSFSFTDLKTKWTLEEAHFDAFNLLVGVSGAGKTKIVEALRAVCIIALNDASVPAECHWSLRFTHNDVSFHWNATTGTSWDAAFLSESITVNERVLVERSDSSFIFNGQSLPRLKPAASALVLLAEDPLIAPICRVLRAIVFSEAMRPGKPTIQDQQLDEFIETLSADSGNSSIFRSRVGKVHLSFDGWAILTALALQKSIPLEWSNLKSSYRAIFPDVQDVDVARIRLPENNSRLELRIIERGCPDWIPQSQISSGMLRTLAHLIELTVAPAGSVIVIDEFENSLGINCMPPLVDFLLERAPDFQYILTSHHPYIINNLPIDTWKLVTRKGSSVRVTPARDIPALRGASHHQAFTRLINLPEYEQSTP